MTHRLGFWTAGCGLLACAALAAHKEPAAPEWKSLIAADQIAAEVQAVRSRVAEQVASVGKYNANYKNIQVEGRVLAVLAQIAAEHPDKVAWQARAPYIRDYAAAVSDSAERLGATAYNQTQAAGGALDQALADKLPAGAAKPADRVPYNQFAPRGRLMPRIERSYTWMKNNVPNAQALEAEADKVRHEATLVAVLAQVVATPGFGSADEADYQRHAQALIQASQDVILAAKRKNFEEFQAARLRMQKTCDGCHVDFRFGD